MTCPHPDALRAAVTDLRCPLCMEAEIERLEAENARLRADLIEYGRTIFTAGPVEWPADEQPAGETEAK